MGDSYNPETYILWRKKPAMIEKKLHLAWLEVVHLKAILMNAICCKGFFKRKWKRRDPQIPKSFVVHGCQQHRFRIVRPKTPNKRHNKMWVNPIKEY